MKGAVVAGWLVGAGAGLMVRPSTFTRNLARPVSYLSEVDEEGKEKVREGAEVPTDPREHALRTESINEGPANYDGFIDAEGFDGGDGQVGVVGDGSNAMETFDKSQSVEKGARLKVSDNAIGGSESKKTQKNVWGYSTGYAEELKKRGMTEIDEYGEDRLQRRRQQLENFRNQREVRAEKEGAMRDLADLQGKDYVPSRHGQYLANMEAPATNELDTIEGRETVALGALTPGATIDGSLTFTARLESRDGTTLSIDNQFSTYSDFIAGFAEGSNPAFTVEPKQGTLNRRGSTPQDFVIKFQPTNHADAYDATFVVKTEDHTWTYSCTGKLV